MALWETPSANLKKLSSGKLLLAIATAFTSGLAAGGGQAPRRECVRGVAPQTGPDVEAGNQLR